MPMKIMIHMLTMYRRQIVTTRMDRIWLTTDRRGYGPHAGGNYAQFGKFGYGGDGGFNGVNYGGYNGVLGQYGQYMGGGGNPLVSEAMYGGVPQRVAGGQFNL